MLLPPADAYARCYAIRYLRYVAYALLTVPRDRLRMLFATLAVAIDRQSSTPPCYAPARCFFARHVARFDARQRYAMRQSEYVRQRAARAPPLTIGMMPIDAFAAACRATLR